MSIAIDLPIEAIRAFCQAHHIRKLSLFGSVLREDFSPDSDIDVLVEFEAGHVPDFFRLYDMEQELSGLVGGRHIDLVTPKALNHRIRQHVLENATVCYEKR